MARNLIQIIRICLKRSVGGRSWAWFCVGICRDICSDVGDVRWVYMHKFPIEYLCYDNFRYTDL